MYSSTIFASALVIVPFAAAAPQIFPFPPFCKLYTDGFDNVAAPAFPETSPLGQYDGVTYDVFAVRNANGATGSTSGVIPHSGSQDVGASVLSDLIQNGAAHFYPAGRINANPSRAFDLYQFYFGCGLTSGVSQAPGTSTACTLSVTGVDIDGNQVPQYTASFSPRNSNEQMVLVQLPAAYRRLRQVQLGVASAVPAGTVLFLDDVTHCNFS